MVDKPLEIHVWSNNNYLELAFCDGNFDLARFHDGFFFFFSKNIFSSDDRRHRLGKRYLYIPTAPFLPVERHFQSNDHQSSRRHTNRRGYKLNATETASGHCQ